MILLSLLVVAIILFAGIVYYLKRDPLRSFEPIDDEELLLLSTIDESFYADLLIYLRTLQMSAKLQDYLKDRRDALESISYFMMLKAARSEDEKRKKWEEERVTSKRDPRTLSHIEKVILSRLKPQQPE
jgi:hypothetical protein